MADELSEVFSELDKLNPDGALLSENSLSIVDDWIDTGCYALNAICSGSLFKGIPVGRIVGLVGPSQCGKTLMANKIVANFQKKDPRNFAAYWDSEIAEDMSSALSVGADPNKIKHYPIDTIPKMRNQILCLLDKIIQTNRQGRFIIVIDSLGNLASSKEILDAEADKQATDMGLRAKEIKSMLRTLTYRAAKAKTTIIFTNHIYADPTAMYETLIKQQAGGKGPEYMASLLIQFGMKHEKQDETNPEDKIVIGAKKVSGTLLHAITAKNRFVMPFLATDLYINFKTGLNKYWGLYELIKGFEILEGKNSFTLPNGQKIGFYKDWRNNKEVWDQILPLLEEKINKEWKYSESDLETLKTEIMPNEKD